jgi:hypothetical protein
MAFWLVCGGLWWIADAPAKAPFACGADANEQLRSRRAPRASILTIPAPFPKSPAASAMRLIDPKEP